MKNYTDAERAALLLEERQHGGQQSLRRYLKRNAWRLSLLFLLLALLLAVGILVQEGWLCAFVIGLVSGFFSRDRAWLQAQRAAWPFHARVIDWEKVQRIADGISIP